MPIAKTAQPVESQQVTQQLDGGYLQGVDGIPIDIFSYFGVDFANITDNEKSKLKDIYEWAVGNEIEKPSLGDTMEKLSKLERNLGVPLYGEKRSDRLWRWVKLSLQINELDKRRKALER